MKFHKCAKTMYNKKSGEQWPTGVAVCNWCQPVLTSPLCFCSRCMVLYICIKLTCLDPMKNQMLIVTIRVHFLLSQSPTDFIALHEDWLPTATLAIKCYN